MLLRLAALFYDSLLVGALLIIASFAYLPLAGGDAVAPGDWLYRLYLLALAYLFLVGFWARDGRTLGLLAWRLRIVDARGRPPGLARASARFALALLSWLPAGAGYLWSLLDGERRTLHDRWAGTWLVHEPKGRR
ncbi:hypothetical protein CKO13_08805 [Halorhodospira neutriphila]|uniref:RDD domain-containing protein n=1 Tax=Halorhodospira neutriphila TaxID=168379 RepID=A0ABS1E5U6_9GAMM|nr:hypothetical protein [Halorhodospira neutriphila]